MPRADKARVPLEEHDLGVIVDELGQPLASEFFAGAGENQTMAAAVRHRLELRGVQFGEKGGGRRIAGGDGLRAGIELERSSLGLFTVLRTGSDRKS